MESHKISGIQIKELLDKAVAKQKAESEALKKLRDGIDLQESKRIKIDYYDKANNIKYIITKIFHYWKPITEIDSFLNDIQDLSLNNKIKYLEEKQMQYATKILEFADDKDSIIDFNREITKESLESHLYQLETLSIEERISDDNPNPKEQPSASEIREEINKYIELGKLKLIVRELKIVIDNLTNSNNHNKQYGHLAFSGSIGTTQIGSLLEKMKGKYFCESTSFPQLSAIYSGKALPLNFQKVKWILLNPFKEPHKKALREFLTLTIKGSPMQKTVDACFTDANGNSIKLSKPKKDENSNYYIEMEKLVKG